MGSIVGRGVRIEVGKTEGTPVVVTGITKAATGVVVAAVGHGLLAKSVGYFRSVEGMVQLEGQAARILSVTTDAFVIEDIDTSTYPDFTQRAEFVPITAWATHSRATSYSIGGGGANPLDDTVLLDDIAQSINGLLAAQTVSMNENSEDVPGEGKAIINKAARTSAYLVARMTLKSGATRVFRGQPSLPGEDVQKGAIGTGSLTWSVKGFVVSGVA